MYCIEWHVRFSKALFCQSSESARILHAIGLGDAEATLKTFETLL